MYLNVIFVIIQVFACCCCGEIYDDVTKIVKIIKSKTLLKNYSIT